MDLCSFARYDVIELLKTPESTGSAPPVCPFRLSRMSAPVLQSQAVAASPDLLARAAAPDRSAQTLGTPKWSYALLALMLFFAIDNGSRYFLKLNVFSQPNQTWAWWAVKALRETGRPDVAIMGSSLMVATVVDTDATYKNRLLGQV